MPLENKQTKNYDTEKINTWTFKNIDLGLKKCLFALTWLTLENLPMWQFFFFFFLNIDKIVTQRPTHDFVQSFFIKHHFFSSKIWVKKVYTMPVWRGGGEATNEPCFFPILANKQFFRPYKMKIIMLKITNQSFIHFSFYIFTLSKPVANEITCACSQKRHNPQFRTDRDRYLQWVWK